MRKIMMMVVLAALAVPVASRAQVTLGLRAGYGIAMGDAVKDGKMTEVVKGQVPLQLDLGYRVTKEITVGGYFGYGFGVLGSAFKDQNCTGGVDCSSSVMRVGVQGSYTFAPVGQLAPWLGVGAGYEWGTLKAEAGGVSVKETFRGIEFLNLQGGADYRLAPKVAVGPFVQLSVGQYSRASITGPGIDQSGSIQDKGVHEWLQFGLRGTFDL